jgi:glycosyltransferase involved in cell wall biosynthesis
VSQTQDNSGATPPEGRAAVSAIVPARNEEANVAQSVRSLSAQSEIENVIVVNDESTDGTGRVLEQLAASEPKLRILQAGPLPAGWVGKNYAVWVGAEQARGKWLLFTDADAVHLPGSTARALADAEATGAAIVSYSPEQVMRTWWERALIPFVFCRLAEIYSYAAVSDPRSPAAAANGQYLLIREDVYRAIGGHAALRGEVLEDVALARRAKQMGIALHFAPGDGIARVRMYRSFGAMWEGWTKNLFPLVTTPGRSITRELNSVIPWLPLLCIALAPIYVPIGVLGLLLLAGRHAFYAAMLRRNRFLASSVLYYVVAVPLYCAALLVSEWRYAHGKVRWKGREYGSGTAKAGPGEPRGEG